MVVCSHESNNTVYDSSDGRGSLLFAIGHLHLSKAHTWKVPDVVTHGDSSYNLKVGLYHDEDTFQIIIGLLQGRGKKPRTIG